MTLRPVVPLFCFSTLLLAQPQAPSPRARAEAARSDLFSRLMARLQEAQKTQGPEAAIKVCQSEAPALAEAVATTHNLRIGRTSWKLRNPANKAPQWAQGAIEARQAEASFLEQPHGGLRALMPIRLAQGCLQCHGDPATLAPGVLKTLQSLYPTDQATGYKDGDLRGWFWVEIPAKKAP